MTTTSVPADLNAAYRDAEARLLAEYGLTRTDDRFVDVPGSDERLHVIELAGDDRIPVVLLHGVAAVTAAAVPLIPAFGGRRVIAPDWPGHGLSGATQVSGDELRTFPIPLLDAVFADAGIERAHLVGHSMGAQFSLYYALAHPERVASVTILGAPGVALPGTRAPFAMRLMSLPWLANLFTRPVSLKRYGANSATTLGKGTVDTWPIELVEVGWIASLRPEFRSSILSYYANLARAELTLTDAEIASLPMPVHALWGDEDAFLKASHGRRGLAGVPDLTFTEVVGGHAPWLNAPAESDAAVRAFLDAQP